MAFSLDELKKGAKKELQPKSSSSSLMTLKSSLLKNEQNLDQRLNKMAAQVLPQAAVALKKMTAELISIIDCSTSCQGTERPTIEGFNELISLERQTGYPTKITTILFNEKSRKVHDDVDVKTNPTLSYSAYGGTALYDTLCRELRVVINRHAQGNRPERTLVAIMTDGNDEHSKYHGLRDARNIISECMALGWEFILLGANINAKEVAAALGIDPKYAENYEPNSSVRLNFKAVHLALQSSREEGKIKHDWAQPIIQNRLALSSSKNDEDGKTFRLGGKK